MSWAPAGKGGVTPGDGITSLVHSLTGTKYLPCVGDKKIKNISPLTFKEFRVCCKTELLRGIMEIGSSLRYVADAGGGELNLWGGMKQMGHWI